MTAREEAALQVARDEIARGETITREQLRSELASEG
jgi:hypothetical protein